MHGFGIIGCGRIAPRHAQSIKEIPNAELIAFADIKKSRAENLSASYGGVPYEDYRYLLDRPDIDVVSICTPSWLHASIAEDVLSAGKNVIIEKPIAMNLEDADRLIALGENSKQKVCVVFQNRFNPPMAELYGIINQGLLGKLYMITAVVRWYRPQKYFEDEWHGSLCKEGGIVLNQSIHNLDALQWLGGPVESVIAQLDTLGHQIEAADSMVGLFKFKNGARGLIEATVLAYPEDAEASISILAEKGTIIIGGKALNKKRVWKYDSIMDQSKEIIVQENLDPPNVYGTSHRLVLENMINAIESNTQPSTNAHEGRKSLELGLAIMRSSSSRNLEVHLPLE